MRPALREAILRSAVLDVVTPDHLSRLLSDPAGAALFAELARQHLPAVLEPGGLRYHPQFREFLQHRLREEDPGGGLRPAGRQRRDPRQRGLRRGGGRRPAPGRPARRGRGARRGGRRPACAAAATGARSSRGWAPWARTRPAAARRCARPRSAPCSTTAARPRWRSSSTACWPRARWPSSARSARTSPRGPSGRSTAPGEWAKLLPLLPPRGRSQVAEVMRYLLIAAVAREPTLELPPAALEPDAPPARRAADRAVLPGAASTPPSGWPRWPPPEAGR